MTETDPTAALDAVLRYHEASKHRAGGFAPGPGPVDWDGQPAAVRRYPGSYRLPLVASRVPPGPAGAMTLGRMLALSLGVTAWKVEGDDARPVRAVPSSGGLYPVEAHVIAGGVLGLTDGIWHYDPEAHGLELRAEAEVSPGLWVALSSVMGREAWKYGIRAFRYTQLDLGHAIGALANGAAAMGWPVAMLPPEGLGDLLQPGDGETPEILLSIGSSGAPAIRNARWQGGAEPVGAGLCDPWPELREVAAATAAPPGWGDPVPGAGVPRPKPQHLQARRSARRFTAKEPVPAGSLARILAALAPQNAPGGFWPFAPAVHAFAMIHKVEGVAPGLCLLPRGRGAPDLPGTAEPLLPGLVRLREGDLRRDARRLSCGQGIAAEGALCLSLVAETAPIAADPWRYRQLHWEAGLLGQRLYHAATAEGLGASGIGCFLDGEAAAFLGLDPARHAVLYHFAIGRARPDPALRDRPPDPPSDW
ncbi:SagB/ThcOx family dehydrogenase [Mangrovicoccus sp. HB161399]|uniref:SagB/ThcOx family dehydrogenase n=1 Tax=Mangrovicoccus sp. HB161399 TaxID=2720392 RepID=UPI001557B39F|nr:SagB/ThcOx family dehydrogenase [Mangrovicoccus sp. HB161399]